jgi:hypothetical protein
LEENVQGIFNVYAYLKGVAKKYKNFAVDVYTGLMATITYDHSLIHKGKGYTYLVSSGSLAAGATYTVAMTTPASPTVHLRPTGIFSSANYGTVEILEAGTYSGGTADTGIINRARMSTGVSTVSISKGVTVSTAGTLIDYYATGSAGGSSNRVGGSGGGADEELVLKPSTVYLIRLTNAGASTATAITLRVFWYEETAVDY